MSSSRTSASELTYEPIIQIARFATHIDSKGVRSSTSSAYLSKPVYKRPNLSILLSTTVTSLLFDKNDVTRVVGVQMGQKKDGPRWIAHAEKEVILSLGAFGSPALLLASGIGPKLDLENLGICAVKNLPVGENLKVCLSSSFIALALTC